MRGGAGDPADRRGDVVARSGVRAAVPCTPNISLNEERRAPRAAWASALSTTVAGRGGHSAHYASSLAPALPCLPCGGHFAASFPGEAFEKMIIAWFRNHDRRPKPGLWPALPGPGGQTSVSAQRHYRAAGMGSISTGMGACGLIIQAKGRHRGGYHRFYEFREQTPRRGGESVQSGPPASSLSRHPLVMEATTALRGNRPRTVSMIPAARGDQAFRLADHAARAPRGTLARAVGSTGTYCTDFPPRQFATSSTGISATPPREPAAGLEITHSPAR